MADEVKRICSELQIEVVEDGAAALIDGAAGNLIARVPGDAQRPTILLTAHLDTVVPGANIQTSIENGRIVSDGTTVLGADDKVGVAAMLEMMRVLTTSKVDHGPIEFLFTVGEESGLLGSRHLDRSLISAQYGFAFDSTGEIGTVVVQGPAQKRIDATVHGRAAHAGVAPEKGISAISVAAAAVAAMKLGRIDEATTANIGSFVGQGPTNIVCDRVDIAAEARSLWDDRLDRQVKHMADTIKQTAIAWGATAEVKITELYPAFAHDSEASVVQMAKRAIHAISKPCSLISMGGGSDANILNGLGIETVNFAVGYENIHTTSEFIRVSDVVSCAELMLSVIRSV